MEQTFFTQAESIVNNRHVWRHMVATPIGNIHIVQYEQGGQRMHEIKTFLFEEDLEKAERKYKSLIKGIADGRM